MDGHHCPTRASSSSSSSSDSASTSSSTAVATIGQQQPQCSISTVFPAAEVTCFPSTAEAIDEHPAIANASMRPQRRRKEVQMERAGEQSLTSPVTAISSSQHHSAVAEPNLHPRREAKTAAVSSSSTSPRPHPPPHPSAQQRVADHIIVVPPADQQIGHQAHQAEQPQQLRTPAEASKKRHSAQSGSHKSGDEGMLVLLQQKLFEHYHTVAYALVIVSYFLAFCEYLYLRLVSLIFPEPIIYRRQCAKHPGEPIYRNELHFASGMVVFLVMSIFQLVCFFLLTVSSKYLEVRRTFSHVLSIEERLHHEAVFAVKRTMFATLYPTFAIYALCSSTIFCSIFYMVGLRDPIVHVGSRVIVHLFDVCVVAYFVAFPALCVLFHPEINVRSKLLRFCCTKKLGGRRRAAVNSTSPSLQTTDGPAKGVINGDGIGPDAAIATAGGAIRRPGAGVVHPAALQHPQQQQPSMTVTTMPGTVVQHGADAVNYGSIAVERRRPSRQQQRPNSEQQQSGNKINNQQIMANNEGEGSMTQSEAAKVRERMRQRRQSRYKRLRGGSDESADCRRPVVESVEAKIWRNEQEEMAGRAEEEKDEDRHKKWEEEEEDEREEEERHTSEEEEEEGEEEKEEEEDESNVQRREEAGTKFHGLELRLDLQDGFGPVTC